MKQILKRDGEEKKGRIFILTRNPTASDSSYVSTSSIFSTSMQHVPGALSEMVKGGKEVHVCRVGV